VPPEDCPGCFSVAFIYADGKKHFT